MENFLPKKFAENCEEAFWSFVRTIVVVCLAIGVAIGVVATGILVWLF